LSTREGARIQGFPDNYHFFGTRSERNLQIGNAVPTFLSRAIKDSVKEHLLTKNKHIETLKNPTQLELF
jgi:DNA (cytosine-5)-methyltransferase 1